MLSFESWMACRISSRNLRRDSQDGVIKVFTLPHFQIWLIENPINWNLDLVLTMWVLSGCNFSPMHFNHSSKNVWACSMTSLHWWSRTKLLTYLTNIRVGFLGCAFSAHTLKVVSIPRRAMLASSGKKIMPQVPIFMISMYWGLFPNLVMMSALSQAFYVFG